MARRKDQEEDSNRGAASNKVAKGDKAKAEVEAMLETASGATNAGDWDTQLRVVPCVFKVNHHSSIEEAQEASHGGHPEQAGVVLAIEDKDRYGQRNSAHGRWSSLAARATTSPSCL